MKTLELLRSARDEAIAKSKIINAGGLENAEAGLDLLGEITISLGDAIETAITQLERGEPKDV